MANLTLFVSKNHSGDLICTANNTMKETHGNITIGTTIKLYRMNVLYAPEVNKMQNLTAIEGEVFALNCSVIFGNPVETDIRWIRNADNRTWDSQTLSINNIARNDSHTYICLANNTLRPTYGEKTIGLSSQSVNIDILYPASINYFVIDGHRTNNNVTVNESDPFTFICGVDSNPGSFMELYFEEESLIERNETKEFIHQVYSAKCTDLGTCFCYANNWLNSPQNKSHAYITVYVNCSPRQSSTVYPADNVTNITCVQHASCILTFHALAYPFPSVQWYKNYNNCWMMLEGTNNTMYILSSEEKLQYTLTFLNISQFDYGQYRVSITNGFGRHIQLFNLIPTDFSTIGPVSRIPDSPSFTSGPPETANSFAIALPAVGGTVGGVLVIALIVAVVTLSRRRQGGRMPDNPNHQNTTNDDDYAVPFDSGRSNVYEHLQTRGSDPQYQQLSTFADGGLQKKDKDYENLRLKGNIEDPHCGGLARHRPTSSSVTNRHEKSLF